MPKHQPFLSLTPSSGQNVWTGLPYENVSNRVLSKGKKLPAGMFQKIVARDGEPSFVCEVCGLHLPMDAHCRNYKESPLYSKLQTAGKLFDDPSRTICRDCAGEHTPKLDA